MIIPEPSQIIASETIDEDFNHRKYQLFENPSPVLPMHFDKKYLPKNLCQNQYLGLYQCLKGEMEDNQYACSYEIGRFQNCRKIRDMGILQGIKAWEIKHIASLEPSRRPMYVQGLTFKLDRLKNDYSRLPSTASKQYQSSRISSQIQQIKWRMKYIKKTIEELKTETKV